MFSGAELLEQQRYPYGESNEKYKRCNNDATKGAYCLTLASFILESMSPSHLQAVRDACARVAREARWVQLEPKQLHTYAQSLQSQPLPHYDPVHHYLGDAETTLAYVMTLDAVNFGSGYFPALRKRPGMSGYFTVASSLKDYFDQHGAMTASALQAVSLEQCCAIFGQDPEQPEQRELMAHFQRAWQDLGALLLEHYAGSFVTFIEAAQHSVDKLLALLIAMPYFQDEAHYHGFRVPLYKRAQITASDLALAFAGQGYGYFHDLATLTIFADNLVPHVLRCDGILRYDPALLATIEAGELLEAGSEAEVEIRAVALHAVEQLVDRLRAQGQPLCAQQLDVMLWNRGQAAHYKQQPRHRCRTVFY